MSSLAAAQELPDADVPWFTRSEEACIAAYPLPGKAKRKFGSGATYYPRRPVESPGRWFANNAVKLRGLMLAEGMPV